MKNKEEIIKHLEEVTKIRLTEEEKEKFSADLDKFVNSLKTFDAFDLTNVKPSYRPYPVELSFLRSDEVNIENTKNIDTNSYNFDKETNLFVLKTKEGNND